MGRCGTAVGITVIGIAALMGIAYPKRSDLATSSDGAI
jgi:hypothetical protein